MAQCPPIPLKTPLASSHLVTLTGYYWNDGRSRRCPFFFTQPFLN